MNRIGDFFFSDRAKKRYGLYEKRDSVFVKGGKII